MPYLDHPDIKFNEHESTEMPFRYVADSNGKPIMPEVSHLCTTLSSPQIDYMWSVLMMLHELIVVLLQGMVELIGKDADKTIDDMF